MADDSKNEQQEESVVVDPELIAEGEAAEAAEAAEAQASAEAKDEEMEITTTEATEEEAAEVEEAVAEEAEAAEKQGKVRVVFGTDGDTEEAEASEAVAEPETDPEGEAAAEPVDVVIDEEPEAEETTEVVPPRPAESSSGPDKRKWPTYLAWAGLILLVGGLIVAAVIGGANCEGVGANGVAGDISKAVPNRPTPAPAKAQPTPPPAKRQVAKAPAVTPAPVTPPAQPAKNGGNVTGVVDMPLEAVNVNATGCKTRVTLMEQGSKVILRTTYSCPPTAVNVVTGNE